MTNKNERKCLQKLYVSSKYDKECFMKTTSYLNRAAMSFFGYKLGKLTFFSGKETIQTCNGFLLAGLLIDCPLSGVTTYAVLDNILKSMADIAFAILYRAIKLNKK